MFIEEIERLERKEEFLKKAILKHEDKFDYSKVNYINSSNKVIIICNKHQIEFSQAPVKHLQNKHCCPLCAKEAYSKAVRMNKEKFIAKSKEIYFDRFLYEKVIPLTSHDKVTIYCKIHDKYFEQRLNSHLKGYIGCKDCINDNKIKLNREQFKKNFIKTFINKFGNDYDFSKVLYINNITPVDVYCKKHNKWFTQIHRNISRTKTCSCSECKKEKMFIKT